MAIGYSWMICWLLLLTFVWPGWLSVWLSGALWGVAAVYWLYELVKLQISGLLPAHAIGEDLTTEFALAQAEYLKGNWFDAEAKLLSILEREPDDVSAALLLVGVLRHTGRFRPALRRLEQIELRDAAANWRFEIQRESKLIEQAVSEESTQAE